MPSLGATFGRGASTTTQEQLANADAIMIMGSNMAENHPIAFRFVLQAKEKGAKIIHVDPRFTRTSALCDIYAPLRAGSDIAFLGGLIRYIINSEHWRNDPFFKEYVLNYTNIATIIEEKFQDASELDGIFSGWEEERLFYDVDTWQYRGMHVPATLAEAYSHPSSKDREKILGAQEELARRPPPSDPELRHPQCVYQILKRHYEAYTPEMVERVTGCPQATFLQIAEVLLANAGRERTGAWCYAVGWTHHTNGVQMIRAGAIIQSLLGNIGRPGGGILALRGHTSIQGSTDVPTLYNLLPGYLPQPSALKRHHTLKSYLDIETPPTGWWINFPKYAISLLRAWYGDAAGPDNDWRFDWIPKISADHSQEPMMLAMADGLICGLLLIGQNPVIGGHNSNLIRKGLANLEWMAVRETFENETASFWLSAPEVCRGDVRSADIKTEIFLLPAALPGEKEGSFTNTQRLIQWHDKLVEAPGDCRSDLWFAFHLGKRLKKLYADSTDPKDEPIKQLTWDYPTVDERQEPSAEAILKEINGYTWGSTWPERRQIADFKDLKDDGSTACGVWIYCGVYPRDDFNHSRARVADPPGGPGTHLNWAFSWPSNRRVMYNRASADTAGKPWSEGKRLLWWDEEKSQWVGHDNPDFPREKAPGYEPDWSTAPVYGMDAHDGKSPFMMSADGKAWLFVPSGLKDAPLPTHYEPVESPVRNLLYRQQSNPPVKKWPRDDNVYHAIGDPQFPYVITTYRLTEHHSGGIPTRFVPSLAELQPESFAEISPELAAEHGVENLAWIVIGTARGEVETRALVTERIRPLEIDGRRIHLIGMPWHFGWQGYATGDIANVLSSVVGDPNSSIHEGKAFTCYMRKGRKERSGKLALRR